MPHSPRLSSPLVALNSFTSPTFPGVPLAPASQRPSGEKAAKFRPPPRSSGNSRNSDGVSNAWIVSRLSGQCQVAHGDGCACLLPATLVANVRALRERAPGHPALLRYREIIDLLCPGGAGPSGAGAEPGAERAAERLDALRRDLGVRSLSAQGVSSAHLGPIIAQSRGGSMKFNPIELHDRELERILEAALAAS